MLKLGLSERNHLILLQMMVDQGVPYYRLVFN